MNKPMVENLKYNPPPSTSSPPSPPPEAD